MKTQGLSVAQNSAITLLASVAGYALTFGASVIVARSLGPEGKGAVQLVVLTHTLALTVANLGLASANSYLVARKRFTFRAVAWHTGWLAAGLGLLAFALTAAIAFLLPAGVVEPRARGYVVLAGALVPFALLTQFFIGALQGAGQIVRLNVLTFTQTVLYALGVAVLLLGLGLGVRGALAAFTIATIGTALLAVWLVALVARREAHPSTPSLRDSAQDAFGSRNSAEDAPHGSHPPAPAKHPERSSAESKGAVLRWNPALLREAFHYGSRAYLSNVVSFLNLRSDQFLLGILAGTAAVGIYSTAVTVAELLLFFPRALSTALLPRITGASREDAGHMAASASRHTLGASLLGLVAIIPLALLIPVIFGALYAPAVIPCLIIAPGIAAYSLAPVLSTYFSGQLGRPVVPSLLAALSLGLDLALVWLFVPSWGVNGAALASAVAYVVTMIVMIILFRRVSGASLRDLFAFRRADFDAYGALASGALGRLRRRA